MNNYWNKLQPSEQKAIILAAIVLVCALVYSLIWQPLVSARDVKRAQVENNQVLLMWMQKKAELIAELKLTSPNLLHEESHRSLLSIVDSRASQLGLRNAITKIEPNGDNKVILWMDEINFDALMVMLGELEISDHISANSVSIKKLDQSAMVKAKINLMNY